MQKASFIFLMVFLLMCPNVHAIQGVLDFSPSSVATGSLGVSGIGAGSQGLNHTYRYHTSDLTATAGTVSYGHIYAADLNGADLDIAICTTAGVVLQKASFASIGTDVAQWHNQALDASYDLLAQAYIVVVVTDDTEWTAYRATDVGNNLYRVSGFEPITNFTPSSTAYRTDVTLSIIFDNQAGDPA